jgi:hypothetical protein
LFYRIFTPASTNFLDFGFVVLNSPAVRTFTVDNISNKKLTIELTSSMPDEILIFTKALSVEKTGITKPQNMSSSAYRKEQLLESISDRKLMKRQNNETESIKVSNAEYSAKGTSNVTQSSKTRLAEDFSVDKHENAASTDYLDLANSYQQDVRKSPRKRAHLLAPVAFSSALKELRSQYRDRFQEDTVNGPSDLLEKFRTVTNGGDDQPDLGTGRKTPPQLKQSDLDVSAVQDDIHRKKEPATSVSDMVEKSNVPLGAFLQLLEQSTGVIPPMFSKASSEEKYVRGQQFLRRELENCILDGRLVPVSVVDIPPKSEIPIVVVMRASGIQKPSIQVSN